jgi:hypothetical protein
MGARDKPIALAFDYVPPTRRINRARREHIAAGAFLGAFAAIAAAVCHELDGGFFLFLFLTPLLTFAGGIAGCVVSRNGWRYVAPLPLALLGGIVLPIHDPHGWVIGGALGGALYGAARRSFDRGLRHAALGAVLGTVAWALCLSYLAGLATLLGEAW